MKSKNIRVGNSPSRKGWQPRSNVADGVVHWKELPFNPELKTRAKELRKAGNLSEVLFWNQIKNKQFLGLDFDRQKIIGNYIVDFYCKNLGFIVEIDGQSHDLKIDYDKKRDNYFESLGLKVFHITDIDVKRKLNIIIDILKDEIGNTPPSGTPLQEGNNTPSAPLTPLCKRGIPPSNPNLSIMSRLLKKAYFTTLFPQTSPFSPKILLKNLTNKLNRCIMNKG